MLSTVVSRLYMNITNNMLMRCISIYRIVCYKRYSKSALPGYTTGQRRGYRNIDKAKEACDQYSGFIYLPYISLPTLYM